MNMALDKLKLPNMTCAQTNNLIAQLRMKMRYLRGLGLALF
jgi:hypothetical protein